MKYYLIAGEASGDLHASRLMRALLQEDPSAQFRFFGGDLMAAAGGTLVKHYKELAYMGFLPVLRHLPTILRNMRRCKADIVEWQPDVLILVDYPGFNLNIASYIHSQTSIPVYYYIAPKIWAWKEHRIRAIKRDIDGLFSILPFEVEYYKKHQYDIHYIGNPTVDEVDEFRRLYTETPEAFRQRYHLSEKPIVALLPGSRAQEIKSNLAVMLTLKNDDVQFVVSAVSSLPPDIYRRFLGDSNYPLIVDDTYALLSHARAAVVTSGTATLETALFAVPQVVAYSIKPGGLALLLKKLFLKVKYISLPNLIADKLCIKELIGSDYNSAALSRELSHLLDDEDCRQQQLTDYKIIAERLGSPGSSVRAAQQMLSLLDKRK